MMSRWLTPPVTPLITRLYSLRHQGTSCPQRLELKALRQFEHVRQKTTARTAASNTIATNRDAMNGPTHQSPRRRMAPKAPKAYNPKRGKKRSDIDQYSGLLTPF